MATPPSCDTMDDYDDENFALASSLDIPDLKVATTPCVDMTLYLQLLDTWHNSPQSSNASCSASVSESDGEDLRSLSTSGNSGLSSGSHAQFICDYAICQQPTVKLCQGCHKKSYCSPQHQQLDWKDHQKICARPLIRHQDDPTLGWIAKLNFTVEKNQVLSMEQPFVILPALPTSNSPVICINCGVVLNSQPQPQTCSTSNKHLFLNSMPSTCIICRWPTCPGGCRFSDEFAPRNLHSVQECRVLLEASRTGFEWNGEPVVYQYLWVVRIALIQLRDPLQFKRMLQLSNFTGEDPHRQYLTDASFKYLEEHIPYVTNLLSKTDLEKVFKIIVCKFRPLHFVSTLPYPKKLKALYFESSIISHSCLPNVQYLTDEFHSQTLVALRRIKKGEILTINYITALIFLPTPARRRHLLDRFNIWCTCERCSDPSELATNYSSPLCKSIRCWVIRGQVDSCDEDSTPLCYLRPVDPKDIEQGWCCPRTGQVSSNASIMKPIQKFLEEFYKELQLQEKDNDLTEAALMIKNALDELLLHRTHYAIFEASWKLLETLANSLNTGYGSGSEFYCDGYYSQFLLAAQSVHTVIKSFVPKSLLLASNVLRVVAIIRLADLTEQLAANRGKFSLETIEEKLNDIYYTNKHIDVDTMKKFADLNEKEEGLKLNDEDEQETIDYVEQFGIEMFVKQVELTVARKNLIARLKLRMNGLKKFNKDEENEKDCDIST